MPYLPCLGAHTSNYNSFFYKFIANIKVEELERYFNFSIRAT